MYKCIRTIALVAVVCCIPIHGFCQSYWSNNRQIPLIIDSNLITLQFDPSVNACQRDSIIANTGYLGNVIPHAPLIHGFVACSLLSNVDLSNAISYLIHTSGIRFVEPFYRLPDGIPFTVGESFVVAFKDDLTESVIDSINSTLGVEISGKCPFRSNVYYLRRTQASNRDLLQLANQFYQLEQTTFAHPNFCHPIVQDAYRLHDYYSDFQWQIQKVVGRYDSASVWDFTNLTESLVVAVLDEGLDIHEDIPQVRVLPGFDFADPLGDPTPSQYESHGMACAGIIGASHCTDSLAGTSTSSGVISLNPHVLILPIGVIPETPCGPDTAYAPGILYAVQQGADILSCSWHVPAPTDDLLSAIDFACAYGRLGLGSPMVFSSGNVTRKFPPCEQVAFPGRHEKCFAVGAVDEFDSLWYYCCHDTTLDVVAPSADILNAGDFWSLDQMNSSRGSNTQYFADCLSGDNNPNYHCHFGGTSAAAAIVSGIASLIISKDPLLTAEDVYNILRRSAVTDLDWGSISPPNTQYGYGRVDAFRAILSLSHGNVNSIGGIDIADISYLNFYINKGGPAPVPDVRLGDCNCDGSIDIADLTYLVAFGFRGGPPPPSPCFEF